MCRTLFLAIIVTTLGACASANRIERGGDRHEARARELEQQGDLRAASKERGAAEKQYSKANTRRGFEDAMPIAFY